MQVFPGSQVPVQSAPPQVKTTVEVVVLDDVDEVELVDVVDVLLVLVDVLVLLVLVDDVEVDDVDVLVELVLVELLDVLVLLVLVLVDDVEMDDVDVLVVDEVVVVLVVLVVAVLLVAVDVLVSLVLVDEVEVLELDDELVLDEVDELELDELLDVLVLLDVVEPATVVVVLGTGTREVVVVAGTGPITSSTHWSMMARIGDASPMVRHEVPGSSFANFASSRASRLARQAWLGGAPSSAPVRWQRSFPRIVLPLVLNFAPAQALASGAGRSASRRRTTQASTTAAATGASSIVRQPPFASVRAIVEKRRASARPWQPASSSVPVMVALATQASRTRAAFPAASIFDAAQRAAGVGVVRGTGRSPTRSRLVARSVRRASVFMGEDLLRHAGAHS